MDTRPQPPRPSSGGNENESSGWAGFGPRSRDGGLDEVPVEGEGRIWLCGKHVVGPDPEAALVRADNASLIVCLNQRHELEDRYPEYVEWLGQHAGRKAVWFPIPDLGAPTFGEVQPLVHELHDRLLRGESAVIHCGAGIGRAPTLAVLLLLTRGASAAEALQVVAAHRPMAGPESGAQSELVRQFATVA